MGGRVGSKWIPGVVLLLGQHPSLGMKCSGPGTGPKPTHTTHSRPKHACPHAHIPNTCARTHTHTRPCASPHSKILFILTYHAFIMHKIL